MNFNTVIQELVIYLILKTFNSKFILVLESFFKIQRLNILNCYNLNLKNLEIKMNLLKVPFLKNTNKLENLKIHLLYIKIKVYKKMEIDKNIKNNFRVLKIKIYQSTRAKAKIKIVK